MLCLVTQLCPTLCDPMDYRRPGSSVHGILQAGILEWVAIPFTRGVFNPGIEPGSPALQTDSLPAELPGIKLMFSALEGEFFTIGPPGKSQDNLTDMFKFLF